MKSSVRIFSLGLLLPTVLIGAQAKSDLVPPQKRQATVATAQQLTQRKAPSPLPEDLSSPFDPPGFDRPEGAENQPPPAQSLNQARNAGPTVPPPPLGDREILEAVAAQLTPTGTIQKGGSPLLAMGRKNFEVGTRFTVTYNNQDYELELIAIERTTFTLRYRGEEITRPIKSVR